MGRRNMSVFTVLYWLPLLLLKTVSSQGESKTEFLIDYIVSFCKRWLIWVLEVLLES